MPLLEDILVEAMTQLYDGQVGQTVTADNTEALARAGVNRATRYIADRFVGDMVYPGARDQIEERLQTRLRQYARTFSEDALRSEQADIRREFIRHYARPLHHYLQYRMEDIASGMGQQLRIVHRAIETGSVSTKWNYREILCVLILVVTLLTIVYFGLTESSLAVSSEIAISIDAALVVVILSILKVTGKLSRTTSVEAMIGQIAKMPIIENAANQRFNRHVVSFPLVPDISEEKEEKQMVAEVEESPDLMSVGPAEFFASVLRINSISQWFQMDGNHPQLPNDISGLIFRFMLPPHISAAMAHLIPSGILSLQFPTSEADPSSRDSNNEEKEEED